MEKVLKKLNDLLVSNHEHENIYQEAFKAIDDEELKSFFQEQRNVRKMYSEQLCLEIEKLVGKSKFSEAVSKESYKVSMNFRNLIFLKDYSLLLNEVYRIKRATISKYNALLNELNLPLSVCKLLVEQRDGIQATMNAIKRSENLIAQNV
ncbi:DUF2383 domain-containing protein [Flavobacteriaceae bacterium SZ-1-7]|uniref:DUF2383 domain-containing protein n=1 Tax=Tamlana sedimenti TaxID=3134126 RepID=UPI00312AC727